MTQSWVSGAAGSGFDADNLPYGVFSARQGPVRIGVRIGRSVLDLSSLAGSENAPWGRLLEAGVLNPLMAAGAEVWADVREYAMTALTDTGRRAAVEPHLHALSDVRMHRPFLVGDYVDFYANEYHATAVGRLFRPGADPLPANWKHLPIGYHGRSGTVVPSGTPIVRPCGQIRVDEQPPAFGPTRRLDIEAELGFVVGTGSTLSYPLRPSDFAAHVFGVCLVDDWSARDIQAWEYVPLGPFLGKSFATSVSHWITPLAALDAARIAPPARTVPLLDYLADDPADPWGLDIDLVVTWNGFPVSRPPFASMYYTGPQLLAHLTANGASTRTGDLFASGTISGPGPDQAGSFLELTAGGRTPVTLAGGVRRTFLEDGDAVTITATAPSTGGGRLALGEVTGTVQPARG
ncbi:fumarylacetoacetase [Nakamurella sp. GG22]